MIASHQGGSRNTPSCFMLLRLEINRLYLTWSINILQSVNLFEGMALRFPVKLEFINVGFVIDGKLESPAKNYWQEQGPELTTNSKEIHVSGLQ